MFGEMAIDILHDHDGAIDHHADGDDQSAQRHEIGGQADLIHDDEGDQRGDDQGGVTISALRTLPRNRNSTTTDQHDAFEQRFIDRVKRGRNQFDPVIERHDAQSVRQQMLLVNVVDFVFDGLHDFTGIAAAQHEHDAGDHFMFAVQHGRAMPDGVPDLHLRHIPT